MRQFSLMGRLAQVRPLRCSGNIGTTIRRQDRTLSVECASKATLIGFFKTKLSSESYRALSSRSLATWIKSIIERWKKVTQTLDLMTTPFTAPSSKFTTRSYSTCYRIVMVSDH